MDYGLPYTYADEYDQLDEKGNVTHLIVKDSRLMHHRFDRVQCCFIQMLYVIDYRRCRI